MVPDVGAYKSHLPLTGRRQGVRSRSRSRSTSRSLRRRMRRWRLVGSNSLLQ